MATAPRKRRWFQFSPRAKLAILAIYAILLALALWIGFQLHVVHERKAFLAKVNAAGGSWQDHASLKFDPHIPSFRQFLGDVSVALITFPNTADQSELDEAARLFPESEFTRGAVNGGFF